MNWRKIARAIRSGGTRLLLGRPAFDELHSDVLTYINYSHCSPESRFPLEKQYLIKLALEKLPSNNPILEIGVFAGRSTNALIELKRSLNISNKVFTTDPWLVCEDIPISKNVSGRQYQEHVKQQFLTNIQFWSGDSLPFSFDFTSDRFFQEWRENSDLCSLFNQRVKLGGPLSCVFLDGDHSDTQVRKDFLNIDAFLEKGGLLYFDDSDALHRNGSEPENHVYVLVREILFDGRYEVVSRNPNYLLRKKR